MPEMCEVLGCGRIIAEQTPLGGGLPFCLYHAGAWSGYVKGWSLGSGKDITRGGHWKKVRAAFMDEQAALLQGVKQFREIAWGRE